MFVVRQRQPKATDKFIGPFSRMEDAQAYIADNRRTSRTFEVITVVRPALYTFAVLA